MPSCEPSRRLDLGHGGRVRRPTGGVVRVTLGSIRRRRRSRRSITFRLPGSARAAGEIDSKGLVWVSPRQAAISAASTLANAKGTLNGPNATAPNVGGWTLINIPGPGLQPSARTARGELYTWSISTTPRSGQTTCRSPPRNFNDALLALKGTGKDDRAAGDRSDELLCKGSTGRIDERTPAGRRGYGQRAAIAALAP